MPFIEIKVFENEFSPEQRHVTDGHPMKRAILDRRGQSDAE
jgi:hypothetical protein